jgi:hypothetical protein
MAHRIALAIAGLLLVAGQAAASGPYPSMTMDILVDGRPLPRYAAYGTWYVEALKDREYAIHLRNPYPVRVAVALSVDGLNTIDARHTTAAEARKWVIEPYGEVTISGWQTSLIQARRFQFTTEQKSYGQWLGKTEDLGIISAVFFRERIAKPVAPIASSELRGEAGGAGARDGRVGAAPPPPAADAAGTAKAQAGSMAARESTEYAATGVGRRTEHLVREVSLDLESTPAASVDTRYEYRPQLVRLGILPPVATAEDPLARRQNAQGFRGFCPIPKRDW